MQDTNLIQMFCTYSNDDSMDSQNLSPCGSISPKAVLIFPKNFLDFRSDTVEKQGIIKLSSYSGKIYTSVVLSNSEVTFLGEGNDAAFRPFLLCELFVDCTV